MTNIFDFKHYYCSYNYNYPGIYKTHIDHMIQAIESELSNFGLKRMIQIFENFEECCFIFCNLPIERHITRFLTYGEVFRQILEKKK